MKDQRKNEIRVGLTVLAGLALLLIGFSVFKQWTFSDDHVTIMMRFPVSGGLQDGDEVTVNGVHAGTVTGVVIDGASVLVTASISGGIKLRADAAPVIQMLELMGGKKIEIRQGMASELHDPGRTLAGTVDPDIAGALGMLGGIEGQVRGLTDEAGVALKNLNGIIGDRAMVEALKAVVADMRAISTDVRTMLAENRTTVTTTLERTAVLTRRADSTLAALTPRLDTVLGSADRAASGADSLISETRLFLKDIRESDGLLRTVLHDTTLAPRLDRLLGRLDSVATIVLDGQLRIKIRL